MTQNPNTLLMLGLFAVVMVGVALVYLWMKRVKNAGAQASHKQVISRDQHPVSRRYMSQNALKVVHRLNEYGYDAYLVGGCVRDIYLDIDPKDFDVATNASPEEVRRIFRNARLIGRRFKLVHVLFGREVIEVATFRANHDGKLSKDKSQQSSSGRILRDNVYGTIEDDAVRRDFTVNALYYDARDFSVLDFCGGVDDLRTGTLRLIGDPITRYKEDPVRMLRAIRFAAKLDFTIEPKTEQPIFKLAKLLRDIPPARLFDEALKMLQSGHGLETYQLLRHYHLFQELFPATHYALSVNEHYANTLIEESLKSTDARIRRDRPVTPAFLFAALLWPPMIIEAQRLQQQMPPVPARNQAASNIIAQQCRHTAIPKRFSMMVRDVWDLQLKLERRTPKTILATLGHPKFRAAYDFLLLRELAGEKLGGAGAWWTKIQECDEHEREQMIFALTQKKPDVSGEKKPANKRRRRRPNHRRKSADHE